MTYVNLKNSLDNIYRASTHCLSCFKKKLTSINSKISKIAKEIFGLIYKSNSVSNSDSTKYRTHSLTSTNSIHSQNSPPILTPVTPPLPGLMLCNVVGPDGKHYQVDQFGNKVHLQLEGGEDIESLFKNDKNKSLFTRIKEIILDSN